MHAEHTLQVLISAYRIQGWTQRARVHEGKKKLGSMTLPRWPSWLEVPSALRLLFASAASLCSVGIQWDTWGIMNPIHKSHWCIFRFPAIHLSFCLALWELWEAYLLSGSIHALTECMYPGHVSHTCCWSTRFFSFLGVMVYEIAWRNLGLVNMLLPCMLISVLAI